MIECVRKEIRTSCCEWGSKSHSRLYCPKNIALNVEWINHMGFAVSSNELLRQYVCSAVVNWRGVPLLRDSAAPIDLIKSRYASSDMYIEETVWAVQHLDSHWNSLPIARVCFENSYDRIVKKSGFISSDQGSIYQETELPILQ